MWGQVEALIRVTPGGGPMRAMKDWEALQAPKVVEELLFGMDGDFEFVRMADVLLCSVGAFMLCIILCGGCVVLCCVNFVILLIGCQKRCTPWGESFVGLGRRSSVTPSVVVAAGNMVSKVWGCGEAAETHVIWVLMKA